MVETTYDDAGRPLDETTTGTGLTGYTDQPWPYESHKAGRVVKTYDDKGRVLDETDYAPNGDVRFTESDRYDQAGNVISETIGGAGSAEVHHLQFRYDFDAHGNWTRKTEYALDSDGSERALREDSRSLSYYN
jgi:hypothetical protein